MKNFFVDVFGSDVYLVGGTIRDFLLYNTVKKKRDIDLVVVNVTYDDIERKLKSHGKVNTVGRSFAVVKFSREGQTFDISIPRKDFKKDPGSAGHKNFEIDSGPHVSLRDDLQRRDFTCNSIALRLTDNHVMDPFDGLAAVLNKKIVMTGSETFFDDPLRILRGARFASVHGFDMDPAIYVHSKKVRMDQLSAERVHEELLRLIQESEKPSRGLQEYFRLTVLEKLFPELYQLSLTIQDSMFHPEKDEFGHHTVWAHTLLTVDVARRLADRYQLPGGETLSLLLGALFHDVGKAVTTRWEFKRKRMMVTSLAHDVKGTDIASKVMSRLKIETRQGVNIKQIVLNLIKNHHRLFEFYRNRDKVGFKSFSRLLRDMDGHDFLLVLLDFADRQSRESAPLEFENLDDISNWYLQRKDELKVDHETIQPLVMGRDLLNEGISPGRKMGAYLNRLYELQLDGEFREKEAGIRILRGWLSGGETSSGK
jgi:tRNA nucleotidyltransferase (CCA-adding enzyme)